MANSNPKLTLNDPNGATATIFLDTATAISTQAVYAWLAVRGS